MKYKNFALRLFSILFLIFSLIKEGQEIFELESKFPHRIRRIELQLFSASARQAISNKNKKIV